MFRTKAAPNTIARILKLDSAVVFLFFGFWGLVSLHAESPSGSAEKGESVCHLLGSAIESGSQSGRKLGRIIRFNLAASDWEECRRVVEYYCKQEIIKVGFVPEGLSGYFHPAHGNPTVSKKTYTVTRTCRVLTPEENPSTPRTVPAP